jgi:hypothetical protein
MGPFSALAFIGAHKSDEFNKLMLFNLIVMAEPIERRSMRSKKPKVHFGDQIAQFPGPLKPSAALKARILKSTKPTIKPGRRGPYDCVVSCALKRKGLGRSY